MSKRLTAQDIASVIHEANRQLRLVLGQTPGPHWNESDDALKATAVNGVRVVLEGASPQELHQEWVELKGSQGWTWGPYKDPANKRHPCMVPYEDLPENEQTKDHLFHAAVTALKELL